MHTFYPNSTFTLQSIIMPRFDYDLTFKLNIDKVAVNHDAKYLHQGSFYSSYC